MVQCHRSASDSRILCCDYKPLRKLDSAHYDVMGHEVKWYKQNSGRIAGS